MVYKKVHHTTYPFLDKRKELKEKMKNTKNVLEKGELNKKQHSVKNTLYGVFASQYFRLGNAVLADNIT